MTLLYNGNELITEENNGQVEAEDNRIDTNAYHLTPINSSEGSQIEHGCMTSIVGPKAGSVETIS